MAGTRPSPRVSRRRALAVLFLGAGLFAGLAYDVSDGALRVLATPEPRAISAASTTTLPSTGRVALVGDSLSAQSSALETARLEEAGWGPIVINALAGRRILHDPDITTPYAGVEAVKEVRAAGPDPYTWIVELGTNDVVYTGNDAAALLPRIEAMLDAIGPGHRIVWINVRYGMDLAASATFNQLLAQVAGQRDDMVVGDWASEATKGNNLIPDGTHLSPTGLDAFARVVTETANAAVFTPAP
jgi:hypothetical protein